MPITMVSLGAWSNTFAAESGIQRKNLLKCGMTRMSGRRLKPGVGSRLVNRKLGMCALIAMAPALQPASDAPVRQLSSMAFMTGVLASVVAR